MPPAVAALADQAHGLVLVSGLAGSGKTATLAAMVDHVNSTRECHIVTIEDPVEVLHADKRAVVDQREVGTDTPSAESALVHALRQDPDVIMVSEIGDATSAWAALQAAETGRLVLSSLSTVSVVDTVERFIDLFQPHQQRHARASLAGVPARRRLATPARSAGGRGRVPAVEVLIVNARVAERIAQPDRLSELHGEMVDGDLYGMQCFDQSLVRLYQGGLVARADVLAHAGEPSEMKFELDRADFERGGAPTLPGSGIVRGASGCRRRVAHSTTRATRCRTASTRRPANAGRGGLLLARWCSDPEPAAAKARASEGERASRSSSRFDGSAVAR